jgi:hypothetical protein
VKGLVDMRREKVIRILEVILVILLLADFIPIKMAVNIQKDDLKKLVSDKSSDKLYICEHTQVTGSIWLAIGDEEGERELLDKGSIYLADPLKGKDPLRSLNKSFVPYYTFNDYIFIGKQGNQVNEGDDLTIDFHVDEWKIVYPIKRNSIRDIYAPKSYLTLYDFIKIL